MSGPAYTSRGVAPGAMLGLFLCFMLNAQVLEAQARRPAPAPQPTGPTPRAGSWEVGGGGGFVGGYDLDDTDALLTRNTTTGSGPFTLFVSDPTVESKYALLGRIGYYFSPRLAVEGGIRFGRPVFHVTLSEDIEDAPETIAEETLDQYLFDGSVLWHFMGASFNRGKAVPFVYGGAGYLRELHEGQLVIETGVEYHAGGGMKFWFSNARRRFGLRGEAGLSFRDGGFDFEEKVRMVPTAGVSLIYLF